MMFVDRVDAGRRLARALRAYKDTDTVVLGLPRGGVPVAYEVARHLGLPLDVLVVRKLGVPYQPELAMGAIGEGDVRVIDEDVLRASRTPPEAVARVERRERAELERRSHRYRGDRAPVSLVGRAVIIVDDGIATGSTAAVACQVARAQGAAWVVLAVPVGPTTVPQRMRRYADEVVCLQQPPHFYAVGQFYRDFAQTPDADVIELLHRAARATPGSDASAEHGVPRGEPVAVTSGDASLPGLLTMPENAEAVVVFAHGSGSSHQSPRNRFVAAQLARRGLASLLFDLLTAEEEADRANVFNIPLLARRLRDGTGWLRDTIPGDRRVGYFGASTGAGAALWAAAEPRSRIAAVVCRGGRPDLAAQRLEFVTAPTLLVVGGDDSDVLDLNRMSLTRLHCERRLEVVPGAGHLFEEPGALNVVADLAGKWFARYLLPVGAHA